MIFSRVSETTLGTFPGHFWSVLGTKLGGVSAFRVVSMSRAVAADVKATGRDKTVVTKAGKRSFFLGFEGRQKDLFFYGFRSNVRHFSRSLLERFWHEIRWRFSVSSGVHESSSATAAAF